MSRRARTPVPGARALSVLLSLASVAGPVAAASPWGTMFPSPDTCYERRYSIAHLAAHPEQRVTEITIAAAPAIPANPWPAVVLRVTLRGPEGGDAEAVAWCENIEDTLFCGMEGDAGTFGIAPAKAGAVLITTGRSGMSFETRTGFATLEARRGDDRSFLLQPCR
jgi:hypothetical protein